MSSHSSEVEFLLRFHRALLSAPDLASVGTVASWEAQRRFAVCGLWLVHRRGNESSVWPTPPAHSVIIDALDGRPGPGLHVETLLISNLLGEAVLVVEGLHAHTDWADFVDAVRAAMIQRLEIAGLESTVARLERAERTQRALFAIADMASSELDMPEMLRAIHSEVAQLMYAENFFIVLYDDVQEALRFIYFSDSVDYLRPPSDEAIPASAIPNSLTLAMLRSGQAQMGPSEEIVGRLSVAYDESLGPEAIDWLGVPMLQGARVRGGIVVQSYLPAHRFDADDRTLLTYVAQHVLTAVDRKREQEALEHQVSLRTRELAERNAELKSEVTERRRSEQLQAALFQIAESAAQSSSAIEFYRTIHGIIGGLLDARNFYVALLNADGDSLEFPYAVDERDSYFPTRKLAKGLTEYVLRTGSPLLANRASIESLHQSGEVASFGAASAHWLGVPLVCAERVVGVIAVQSYDTEARFTERDQELLTFVAIHVANAIERQRAQESLRLANLDLEQRVAERTVELAIANRDLTDQIHERERIEGTLKHQALHDALTGLPNRTLLLDRLGRALQRFRRDETRSFAVLFLDLDRFKFVNDSVGHLVGDELLKEAAERIAASLRTPDTVARLGGDEFAILLEELEHPDRATNVADRLIATLAEPMRIAGKELFTSASVGIAYAHPRYTRAEELLRDADAAMYRAKAQGRQRYEMFDEILRAEAVRVLDLEGDLRRAITRGEFEPYFQPIVRLTDRRVVGYEALLRWNHSERGLMLPAEFLSVAEDNGAIEVIDWQMFTMACRDAQRLPEVGAYVCINVSARQLRSPGFAQTALRLIATSGLDPGRVRLEVTEGVLLENPDHVCRLLETLREAGVRAQLDDFGTGYSSLSYLHRFPIHSLKIDRSFVGDLCIDTNSSTPVVRAIHALAESLGIEVIGEGIETEEQCQALSNLGCQLGQGYWFARPGPLGAWVA